MLEGRHAIIIFIIITTLFILILIAFIVFILFLYQRRHIAHQKGLENLRIEFEKDLLKAQVEIQEDTLMAVSREIHDNIGLSLTLAKLNLNTVQWKNLERSRQQVEGSVEHISKAIEDLSNITKELHSDFLKEQGLLKGLESAINRIQKTERYKIDYCVTGEDKYLSPDKDLMALRIVQEILTNCIKHSEAHNIEILVVFNDGYVNIKIGDNGKGFAVDKVTESGTGLKNIKKRTTYIGGTCDITSIIGKGTTFNLKIPL